MPRKRILIADDDKDIVNCMEVALEDKFDIVKVYDGLMCLAVAMKAPPDLILLDITMPKMSGYQVMDNLKRHPQLKTVPIVLVTAKATLQEKEFGMKKGAAGYLAKPFNMNQLIYEVEKILTQKGIKIYKTFVGNYMTALEMSGCSLTLLKLDDELKELIDYPCNTPAMKGGE